MKSCHEYNLIIIAIRILLGSSWQSGPSLRANTKKKLFTTHQFLAMKLDTPVFG